MNSQGIIDTLIERKLLKIHTAYLGKILSTDGKTAKIQPLMMFKQLGQQAKQFAAIPNVPILNNARFRVSMEEITYLTDVTINTTSAEGFLTSATPVVKTDKRKFATLEEIAAGDVVFCVCSERDITEAKKGNLAAPALGHHSLTDSVIVGVI